MKTCLLILAFDKTLPKKYDGWLSQAVKRLGNKEVTQLTGTKIFCEERGNICRFTGSETQDVSVPVFMLMFTHLSAVF